MLATLIGCCACATKATASTVTRCTDADVEFGSGELRRAELMKRGRRRAEESCRSISRTCTRTSRSGAAGMLVEPGEQGAAVVLLAEVRQADFDAMRVARRRRKVLDPRGILLAGAPWRGHRAAAAVRVARVDGPSRSSISATCAATSSSVQRQGRVQPQPRARRQGDRRIVNFWKLDFTKSRGQAPRRLYRVGGRAEATTEAWTTTCWSRSSIRSRATRTPRRRARTGFAPIAACSSADGLRGCVARRVPRSRSRHPGAGHRRRCAPPKPAPQANPVDRELGAYDRYGVRLCRRTAAVRSGSGAPRLMVDLIVLRAKLVLLGAGKAIPAFADRTTRICIGRCAKSRSIAAARNRDAGVLRRAEICWTTSVDRAAARSRRASTRRDTRNDRGVRRAARDQPRSASEEDHARHRQADDRRLEDRDVGHREGAWKKSICSSASSRRSTGFHKEVERFARDRRRSEEVPACAYVRAMSIADQIHRARDFWDRSRRAERTSSSCSPSRRRSSSRRGRLGDPRLDVGDRYRSRAQGTRGRDDAREGRDQAARRRFADWYAERPAEFADLRAEREEGARYQDPPRLPYSGFQSQTAN